MTKIERRWIKNLGFVTDDLITAKKIYVTHRNQFFVMDGQKGFSISKDVLEILRQNFIDEVRIIFDKKNGSNRVYVTERTNFDNGLDNRYGLIDVQKFVPIENFRGGKHG